MGLSGDYFTHLLHRFPSWVVISRCVGAKYLTMLGHAALIWYVNAVIRYAQPVESNPKPRDSVLAPGGCTKCSCHRLTFNGVHMLLYFGQVWVWWRGNGLHLGRSYGIPPPCPPIQSPNTPNPKGSYQRMPCPCSEESMATHAKSGVSSWGVRKRPGHTDSALKTYLSL